jgi:hypothetical protein
VRRSLNGGASWSTVDSYLGGGANDIGTDASGNIYVVGSNADHWIVRKSSNGGASWSIADDFLPLSPPRLTSSAAALGFAASASGNLFAVGLTRPSATSIDDAKWVVRESVGGTGSWQTVDTFQYVSGQIAVAESVVADNVGNVYVGGWGTDATVTGHWLVRKLSTP